MNRGLHNRPGYAWTILKRSEWTMVHAHLLEHEELLSANQEVAKWGWVMQLGGARSTAGQLR